MTITGLLLPIGEIRTCCSPQARPRLRMSSRDTNFCSHVIRLEIGRRKNRKRATVSSRTRSTVLHGHARTIHGSPGWKVCSHRYFSTLRVFRSVRGSRASLPVILQIILSFVLRRCLEARYVQLARAKIEKFKVRPFF